ncbi:MAG: ribbon-helix-helix protein, CopG family [Angustibacter sp.]
MAVRLSVNINDETEAALKELAAKKGTTVTEIVRRAVSVYKFVDEQTGDGQKTLQLVGRASDDVVSVAMIG